MLIEPGEAQWFALRVLPQKEYVAAYLLERQPGVWAFVPTEPRFARRTRYGKGQVEYARPELPGLVIARFEGEPIWYNVMRNNLIVGPLGRDGEAFRLKDMVSFLARVPTGTLVLRDGTQLVNVRGRELRAPTSHKRIISRRKRDDEPEVIEAKGRVARWLDPFVLPKPMPLRAAA